MASWERFTDSRVLTVAGGLLATGAAVAVAVSAVRRMNERTPRKDYPRDTVIVHQLGRAPYAPSLVPFDIKLETFLRITKVPFINVFDNKQPSSKGKWPWIEYNGQVVADSEFCIEFLKKERDLDLNKHLSSAERATARAFQTMLEVNSYWPWVLERWYYDKEKIILRHVSCVSRYLIYWGFPQRFFNQAQGHGIGRHSREDLLLILQRDLRAISDFLGEKKFMMGDGVSEVDCACFGQLAEMKWQCPDSVRLLVDQTYPNISQYCDRMKDLVWPDWDDCTTRGGTQDARK
jgi:hypothetical protein